MFTTRPTRRPTIACALACAVLVSAMGTAAAAQPIHAPAASDAPARSQSTWGSFESIATSRSGAERQDLRSPDARDASANARKQDLRHLRAGGHPVNAPGATAVDSATRPARPGPLPQERYYSSYGEPAPLAAPQPTLGSDDTLWLPIALAIAAALAVTSAAAIRLARLRIRRRAARVAT